MNVSHRAVGVAFVALLAAVGLGMPGAALGCGLGAPIAEHVLLRSTPGTFYSVDALNPDVVTYRGKYMMFFSGNDSRTSPEGHWRTGVAVSRSPAGPFRVDPRLHGEFGNGGTLVRNGQLYHATSGLPDPWRLYLLTSPTGVSWHPQSEAPGPTAPSWRKWQADASLYGDSQGINVYYAARPGPAYADIGTATYRRGRWGNFRRILRRGPASAWDHLDLGEPAVFRARNRTYLLYVGMRSDHVRQIGLAYRTSHGRWRRCGSAPLIRAGGDWYRRNAIDPSAVVVGDRLYVYFGGGLNTSVFGDMHGVVGVRVYRLRH